MRIWLALIVAPLLALTDQSVAFAMVQWACTHQRIGVVHVSHVAFLALAAMMALGARQRWRETSSCAGTGEAAVQSHFLAGIAMMVAVLSVVAIIAMWIPTWIILPCAS